MTGAGSSTVAWAPEVSYLGGVGDTPTYREPGTNVQAQTAELTNNLLAILAPGDVEAQQYLAQNLGGQLALSWILKNDEYHRLVFNDSNTGFATGLVSSAEVYLGVDHLNGTTERQIQGWAPTSLQVAYQEGSPVRVTAAGPYGDEARNTSITPSTIDRAGDEVPQHGASLTINGVDQTKLQSATLSLDNLARLHQGPSRHPLDAVRGAVEESLSTTATYEGDEQLELAYGGAGSSSTQDDTTGVSASLSFAAAGSTVASYTLSGAEPESYGWSDLVNNEQDLTENVEWRLAGVTGSDPDV